MALTPLRRPALVAVVAALLCLAGCRSSAPAAGPQGSPTPLDPALTGGIAGRVLWQGPPLAPAMIDMRGAAACGAASQPDESLVVNSDGTVRWAFVYIARGLESWRFAVPAQPVTLDQRGCRFEPHVFGIMAGQPLRIISSDATIHNVHAEAKLNRPWNESMTPGMAPLLERFTVPEIMVPIRCNVHAWMEAFAGVVSNPYFAVTGTDGAFVLKNVPAGTYTLAVWQERLGTQEQTVTVLPRKTSQVSFLETPRS
ncbi:MAG TPA: hypothetical protein VE996_10340 [Terriglobales bacterium]|nr:hypothetical protein [Terriglobales bacterium]